MGHACASAIKQARKLAMMYHLPKLLTPYEFGENLSSLSWV